MEEAKPAVRTVASNAELEAEVRINKLRVCIFSAFWELLREVGRFTYVCVYMYMNFQLPPIRNTQHPTTNKTKGPRRQRRAGDFGGGRPALQCSRRQHQRRGGGPAGGV